MDKGYSEMRIRQIHRVFSIKMLSHPMILFPLHPSTHTFARQEQAWRFLLRHKVSQLCVCLDRRYSGPFPFSELLLSPLCWTLHDCLKLKNYLYLLKLLSSEKASPLALLMGLPFSLTCLSQLVKSPWHQQLLIDAQLFDDLRQVLFQSRLRIDGVWVTK